MIEHSVQKLLPLYVSIGYFVSPPLLSYLSILSQLTCIIKTKEYLCTSLAKLVISLVCMRYVICVHNITMSRSDSGFFSLTGASGSFM